MICMVHKILIMHQSKTYAGTDEFAINLIEGLSSRGFQVEIIINKNKDDLDVFTGVPVHFYTSTMLTFYSNSLVVQYLKKIRTVALYPVLVFLHLFSLYKQIRKIKPNNIIIINGGIPGGLLVFTGALVCGISNIQTLYTVHNFVKYQKLINYANIMIEYITSTFDNIHYVTVSNYAQKRLVEDSHYVKNIGVIYNGIPNNNKMKDHRKECPEFNVVFIGTLIKSKGVSILLDAFMDIGLSNMHLYLYVKSIDQAYTNKIISIIENQNNIHIILDEHNKQKIFYNKHLLVLPSTDYESFGQVLIEAMTFGIPVIGSNGLGISEVVNIDRNIKAGELFDLGDAISLKGKILKFYNTPTLYNTYAKNGPVLYEKYFTREIMVNNYINYLGLSAI